MGNPALGKGTTVNTTTTTTTQADAIDALTLAVEFLQCSIRAIVHGADMDSPEAHQPVDWALSKIDQARGLALRADFGVHA